MVLTSSFKTGKAVLNKNHIYPNWNWIIVRINNSKWKVVNQGMS